MRYSPLFLVVWLYASTTVAATYVVTADGSGDFPTIQAAISAAINGDVIELTDGTFTGEGNRDIEFGDHCRADSRTAYAVNPKLDKGGRY